MTRQSLSAVAKFGHGKTHRPLGPPADSEQDGNNNIISTWERWEIRWTMADVNSYARQLDFFAIELGAVGGSQSVDYAYNVRKARPDHREGHPAKEKRLYMTWRGGTIQKYDRTLLARAGIRTEGRFILHFYPTEVEEHLARLELQNASGRNAEEFLKTTFGVHRADGDGYEFYVVKQRFRPKSS